jgi:hypothetical protein
VVTIDLWGNGSGHFTTDPEGLPLLGNPAVALTALRDANNLTGVTYTGTLGTGGPGGSTLDSPAAGITLAATDGVATVTAVTDADYCSKTNNHTATVNITALMAAATDAAQVTPSVARTAAGVVGGISFDVMCPSGSGSAAQGQELVPDNPFPTDR